MNDSLDDPPEFIADMGPVYQSNDVALHQHQQYKFFCLVKSACSNGLIVTGKHGRTETKIGWASETIIVYWVKQYCNINSIICNINVQSHMMKMRYWTPDHERLARITHGFSRAVCLALVDFLHSAYSHYLPHAMFLGTTEGKRAENIDLVGKVHITDLIHVHIFELTVKQDCFRMGFLYGVRCHEKQLVLVPLLQSVHDDVTCSIDDVNYLHWITLSSYVGGMWDCSKG